MFCTNCGKLIEPESKFCPDCGARQTAGPPLSQSMPVGPPAPAAAAMTVPAAAPSTSSPAGRPALWAGAAALVVALVGGVGYWGWSRTDDHVVRQLADEEQRRVAAEKVAEAAEITAAQALLDKHIAVEEAEAQARARSSVQDQNKRTTVNR